jgi:hypothetical protein
MAGLVGGNTRENGKRRFGANGSRAHSRAGYVMSVLGGR